MSNVSGRSWPTKRLPDQFGAPSNAAVGSVPDLPKPRNSAAATQAMDILADAVWRIDARDHQNSGAPLKVVRNLGTGGSVLDCRTGSTSVPDTNDPLFLPAGQSAYVYLPGSTSNYLSVPDSTDLDITGDIDIRVEAAADAWTGVERTLLAKWNAVGGQLSYLFTVNDAGRLIFYWTENGTTILSHSSSVGVSFAAGQRAWVRVRFRVNTGSGRECIFETSNDGTNWTQLGSTQTNASTTSIFSGTNPVNIGLYTVNLPFAGKFYRAIIKSGIDGTTVLDVDTSVLTTGSATSFTAATGQTVTINRSTSGRKTVVVPSSDVKKVDDANVYLPGVAGNYLSVPDENALDITGDIDIRVRVKPATFNPSAENVLLAKDAGSGTQRSFYFSITNGKLNLYWWETGGTLRQAIMTATDSRFIGGTACWLRVALDVDAGGGNRATTFYWAPDAASVPSSWTALETVTAAGTTSIRATTAIVTVGSDGSGTYGLQTMSVYRTQVLNGIGGTTVLDIDCTIAPTNFTPGYAAAFPAVTGQTVTMNSTAGSAMRVNGERYAAGSPVWLFGTDDYMEVPLSATGSKLLDFGPNDSFTVLAVARRWATQANAQLIGKRLSNIPGVGWLLLLTTTDRLLSYADSTYGALGNVTNSFATSGPMQTFLTTFDSRRAIVSTANGNSATGSTPSGSVTNQYAVRLGQYTSGTGVADMEFVTAAIWRRALTAAEISTLTQFFQGRVA